MAAAPRTTLLHGATGSGKTEVYLRLAEQVLASGRQALVLVPEINLTPQLEERLQARFPHRRVVALHSGLTPAQRLQNWLAAHLGQADLVLGTRMAVFASLPRLGLIVVDEEHDPSYKQQEGARYSARDLAVYRGRLEGLPVILGSATPSLESWCNADPAGFDGAPARYRLLTMPTRIGAGALPSVRLLDLAALRDRLGKKQMHDSLLPPPLVDALKSRLDSGEQSLVLLNRRGYAPVLHCTSCGWKSACSACSAWRVFHKSDRSLRCHHCGFAETVPRACPQCGDPDIQPVGRGTERIEEQLTGLLPGARIGRIDADTTRASGSLVTQLAAAHAGEVDLLVGTQMLAKGHDFRRVTLVAVLNADSALFSADFRAPERLFALLMQAGGRAGRDAARAAHSEVWVPTWYPSHPIYAAIKAHDYAAFAASQIAERQGAGLPPFSHLALLRAEARDADQAMAFLDAASVLANQVAQDLGTDVLIYPPVPAALRRVANVERAQMLIESPRRAWLQQFLRHWCRQLGACNTGQQRVLRWAVDVDPASI
jgi:primosomal protein N' (replication factor Y)